MLIGTEGVVSLLESAQKGDPLARKQADEFLKLFLGGDNSALSEKTQPSASTPLKTKPDKTHPKQPKPPQPARPADTLNKDVKK
jgi:hypothetical protein